MQTIDAKEALGIPHETFLLGNLKCSLLETADGSFSLRYCANFQSAHWTEPMHSSKGAWSETLYVYEPALRESLIKLGDQEVWGIASIGLGLGYNELLSAAIALQQNKTPSEVTLTSFESQIELRDAFKKSFLTTSVSLDLPPPLILAQKKMISLICGYVGVPEDKLRSYLKLLFDSKSFQVLGAWTKAPNRSDEFTAKAHQCILFDAFSPDSSPDLWDEELLQDLLDRLAHQQCIFASYASRNNLKKILRKNEFILESLKGFAGKRERTFAHRYKT